MCTGLSMMGSKHYFGRNLDLEYDFGQQVVITPREYEIKFSQEKGTANHYAIIGMASVVDNYPLFADAINEKGLGMAGLHFALTGSYPSAVPNAEYTVSPYEYITWVLSQCATLAEARDLVEKTTLSNVPFSANLPLSMLHWMVSDATGSFIIEPMADGLVIRDDPHNVLTNDPTFEFQTTNLNYYLNLTAGWPTDRFAPDAGLKPLGKGMGALGLPGDSSAVSRFVRIAFNSANSVCPANEPAEITQFFHLLDSVASLRGPVQTEEGKYFITRYSACMVDGDYYYKTYENNQITRVSMSRVDLDGKELSCYSVDAPQQIKEGN